MAYSPLVNFLMKATRKSTRLLSRDYFELENLQSSKRPTTDFVKISKAKVEATLQEELAKYPNSTITQDISQIDKNKDIHFVISPIDGELNLCRAIPFFASVVVACEYKDGNLLPLVSIVNFPALGDIMYAEHGRGVMMERSIDNASGHALKLRVSSHNSLDNALIISDLGMLKNGRSVGCDIYGSYLVAAGKADIMLSNSMTIAARLATGQLVHEAGGSTQGTKEVLGIGAEFVASNGKFDL